MQILESMCKYVIILRECDAAQISISGRDFILSACDVGAVWHLTFRKISPSQDSFFEHMVSGK